MFSTQFDHVSLFDLFVLESRTSWFILIYIIPPILIPDDVFSLKSTTTVSYPCILHSYLGSCSVAYSPKPWKLVCSSHEMIGGECFASVNLELPRVP